MKKILILLIAFVVSQTYINAQSAVINTCNNAIVPLNPNSTCDPGTLYNWFPAINLSCSDCINPMFQSNIPGTYTYTLTYFNSTNCTGNYIVEVNVSSDSIPVIIVAPSSTYCRNASLLLGNISNPTSYTYNWTAPGFTASSGNPIVNPSVNTTYSFNVTNGNCPTPLTGIINIAVEDSAKFNLENDTAICKGVSIKLSNSVPQAGVNYAWTPTTNLSNSGILNTFALANGIVDYTVSANNKGCIVQKKVKLNGLDMSISINGNDTVYICKGSGITLSATVNPSTQAIRWKSPIIKDTIGNNITFNPQTTTTYTSIITNQGCTKLDSVKVFVDSMPPTMITASKTLACEGDTIYMNSLTYDPVLYTRISFQWEKVPKFFTPDTLYNMIVEADTTRTYRRLMKSGGCTRLDSVVVTVLPTLKIILNQPAPFCPGGNASLGIQNFNLLKDVVWAPKDALICGECKDLPSALTLKLYRTTTISVTGKNKQGDCPAIGGVTVEVFPEPSIKDPTASVICKGANTVVELNPTPTLSQTYIWNIANQVNIPNPKVTPKSDSTYTVMVTTDKGCKETKSFDIKVADSQLRITGDSTSCVGGLVNLNAEPFNSQNLGAPTFKWSSGQTSQNISFNLLQNGTYSVTMTYGNGCTVSSSFNVKVIPTIGTIAIDKDKGCQGDPITLTTTTTGIPNIPAPTYMWSEGNSTISTNSLILDNTKTYSVTVTYGNGCKVSTSKLVTAIPSFSITLTKKPDTTTVLLGSSPLVTVKATGNTGTLTYSWQLNSIVQSSSNSQDSFKLTEKKNVIQVTVTSTTGCGPKTAEVEYETVKPEWVVPTAFTPNNGDTINDRFRIVFTNKIPGVIGKFLVFDRFGKEVFAATDNKGWDGKFNDNDAPADTYTYIVEVLSNDFVDSRSGVVTLLR